MKLFFGTVLLAITLISQAAYTQTTGQNAKQLRDNTDGTFTLALDASEMTIDAKTGGRIISLKINKSELLSGPEIHPYNYGSTFWPSPQSMWNWPPRPSLDYLPYEVDKRGDTLILTGATDDMTGLQFKKKFYISAVDKSFAMAFVIINRSNKNISAAPWQITRLEKGTKVFFPKGQKPVEAKNFDLVKLQEHNGIYWFNSLPEKKPPFLLSRTDGNEGWLAAVKDSLLLIKAFKDINPERQAPGEGEILLYSSGEGNYIEMEAQGEYNEIAPGESREWKIKWYGDCLSGSNMTNEDNLVNYVRQRIK